MRRVILHIGRQKTGTTAIQRIKLPRFGRKHNDIVEGIRRNLLKEIPNNDSHIVISSESFQNCDPRLVSQLFRGFQVEVVVYLREQVAFMASAYAHKIQVSDYCGSLEEFCLANMSSNYYKFIKSWNREFTDNVTVKIYDKKELIQGDIVVDFCASILHLSSNTVKDLCAAKDPNPTLTSDLLEMKLRVNRTYTLSPEQARLMFIGLAELSITDSSGKIAVPPYMIENIANHYDESNRRIAKQYFSRKHLFSKYNQPEHGEQQRDIELRLNDIRDKLISLHPTLAEPLANISQ